MKKIYRVTWEIEIDAVDPIEASKISRESVIDGSSLQYYVQDTETSEVYSVDLNEEDEDMMLLVPNYQPLID